MLDPLASESDLTARNIAVPDGFDVTAILNSASAAIRDAAGCPISETTSTVTLFGDGGRYLDLPGGPVTSVASVAVDGEAVSDWQLEGGALYRPCGWRAHESYAVTYTHGFASVPADIVDMACGLAAMAFNAAGGGYGAAGSLQATHLAEYGESYFVTAGADRAAGTPMSIPASVRQRLRERFGTSVATVGWRR